MSLGTRLPTTTEKLFKQGVQLIDFYYLRHRSQRPNAKGGVAMQTRVGGVGGGGGGGGGWEQGY